MSITPSLALTLLITASVAMAQMSPSLGALGSGTYGITMKDMTNPNPYGAFEGGQQDPLAKNDDFFKKCGTVPYRLCTASEQSQKDAWEAQNGKAKKGNQAALEKRMAVQRKLRPDTPLLDMGDGQSFGIIMGDSISIDNGSSCGMPRPTTPDEKAKLANQDAREKEKQAAKAQEDNSINGEKNGSKINAGKGAINNDSDMTSNSDNETNTGNEPGGNAPISITNSGYGSGGDYEGGGEPPSGNKDGKSLFAMNVGMRGGTGGGTNSEDSLGGRSGGDQSPVAAAGKKGYIAMDGNKAAGSFAGFTWRQNADADANAKREAAAVEAAWKGNGRPADVPLNNGRPAGVQAVENTDQ